MLARLDQAISEFRYAPIPLDKDAVTEAIAFLEWLRDDNFTFLGMREFRTPAARRAARWSGPTGAASASSPIPTCGCCAATPRALPRRPRSAPSCTGPTR